jgi:hypothetical protein
MRKANFYQNVDRLIRGIDSIVSKNRCSFSDEELQLLQECKSALLKFKKAEKGIKPDPNVLVRVISVLSRIFFTLSHFDEMF